MADDGERVERIRPDPLPASPLAQKPSIKEQKPEPSGQRAPGFGASGEADNLVRFPAPEKPSRGRKRKSVEETYRVDYVKASKNTWAFRIRWMEDGGREPVIYVSRVNDKLFKMITKGRANYAAFKRQLIASHKSGAVRQSVRVDAGSNRAL